MSAQIAKPFPGTTQAALVAAWFEGMAEPVLLCDANLLVLAANRAASELLKLPAGDLIYRSAFELLPPRSSGNEVIPTLAPRRMKWRSSELQVVAATLTGVGALTHGWVLTLRRAGVQENPPEFIGSAPVTQELMEFVNRIACSRSTSILLLGESGTGKELIAKRLHALSPRAAFAFVPINCAALPLNLLESELFGYEKGAFTGAHQSKAGLLEIADGGTVFLDEICELPLALQAKLLRVLEDHTFRRLGGVHTVSPSLRVVGATNADLEKAITEGRFRSDLYYRLNAVQIRLPALRERIEDIRLLAMHFLDHFNRVHHRQVRDIHPTAQRMLDLHPWPGNVRELRNVIERAALVETTSRLTPASLALSHRRKGQAIHAARIQNPARAASFSLRSGERELIAAALAETDGNQSRAAALLGIGRFSLRYRMKKLGML